MLMVLLSVAVEAAAATAGYVASVSGSLLAARQNGRKVVLGLNSPVEAGDILHTDTAAWASIRFNDGGTVVIKPDSRFQVREFEFRENDAAADKAVFVLLKGGLRALTGLIGKRNRLGSYSMRTPTATIGIRGTGYGLQYCVDGGCAGRKTLSGQPLSDGLHLEVFDGAISVTNNAGSIDLGAGTFGFVKDPVTPPATVSDGYRDPLPGATPGECAID
jgi:hypothetical protein